MIPKTKRFLSKPLWLRAWHDYAGVYTQRYPHALPDLFTYVTCILSFMDEGVDWYTYDRQFRIDREFTRCRWSTFRADLEAKLFRQSARVGFRTHPSNNTPARPIVEGPQKPKEKTGHCFKYNSRDARCTDRSCDYRHTCSACSGTHPRFLCKSPGPKPSGPKPVEKPSPANPSKSS